jgi:flagellin-like protein
MKGITPVIAVILLLMITISLVGFAFVWFTRMTESMTNQTSESLNQQMLVQRTRVTIDSYDKTNGKLMIRNAGSVNLELNKVNIYVNGGLISDCSWSPSGSIAPGVTSTCTSNGLKTCTGTIVVTSIGTGDSIAC